MIALHDILSHARDEATPVCRDGDRCIDIVAFRANVAAWIEAHALAEGRSRRIALCLDDPFDFACALFAVLAAGHAAVIPASATPGHLDDLAGMYDLLLDDAATPAVMAAVMAAVRPAAISIAAGAAATAVASIDPSASLTLYTSGSNGAPRPIHKTLAQFDAEVRTLERQWGALLGTATMLASVPHHHIYGLLFRVLWPLAAGRAFDRATCSDPLALRARSETNGGSVAVVSTPAQLSRWVHLPGFDAPGERAPIAWFSSGGPLAAETATHYTQAFGHAPLEIYGSTETGGIAWRCQSMTDAWQAMPGIDIARTGDGALQLRSPHLPQHDWYRTDDAITLDADGRFHLQGRLDRVTKLDGKRVSLADVEARLALHPHVAQAAVTPLARGSRTRLGALVELSDAGRDAYFEQGRVELAKTLRRHLAAWFDLVLLPRHWRFADTLPFDGRGKLPAARVAAAFDARSDGVEVLAAACRGHELRYDLRVPPSLVHFDGHFPGFAILPGVVQIDWAIRLASEYVPHLREVVSIDRLKFTAPVPPGALLSLTLMNDPSERRVRFSYRLGERDSASGVIVYGARA